MANRCYGSNIKLGDKYSIRYVDKVHWFLEIQSTKKNGEKCYLTMGLNVFLSEGDNLYKNVPGPHAFKGRTIITSPDEVENNCHYRLFDKKKLANSWRCRDVTYFKEYPKKFLDEQPKEYFQKNKIYLRGKPVRSWKKILFGRENKQYTGKLNETQLEVIKVFLEKKSKVITDKRNKYKHVILNSPYFLLTQYDPFILDKLEKWGIIKNNWWNCRKFSNYFHRRPADLLKYIKESTVLPQDEFLPQGKKSKSRQKSKSKSRQKSKSSKSVGRKRTSRRKTTR